MMTKCRINMTPEEIKAAQEHSKKFFQLIEAMREYTVQNFYYCRGCLSAFIFNRPIEHTLNKCCPYCERKDYIVTYDEILKCRETQQSLADYIFERQ